MMADNCSKADWRQLAEKALAGAPFSTLVSHSEDGIAYGPVYAEAAVRPILRGTLAPWSIAQRLDDPDPARANHQALADLDGGADALVLVLEGASSAHGFGFPAAALETALAGVMLDIVHLRLEGGEDALAAAEGTAAIALAQGVPTDALDLDLCQDPAGAMAVAGRFPPDDHDLQRAFATGFERYLARGFTGRFAEADGRIYHEAGATEAQELGAVLASAVYALRSLDGHGVDLSQLPRRIGFTLAADQKQWLVTAKLRALRLLWQRVQLLSGIADPAPARLHVETSMRMMTAVDPHGNILRTTIAAFAAATGGADRISVLPFTAANGLPEAKARRLARNTQLILRDEAGLGHVGDPAAGSGGIEALTASLAAAAWQEFRQIESEGGLFSSLRQGHLQRRIAASRADRAAAIADRSAPIVGVTLYPLATPRDIAVALPRPAEPAVPDGAPEPTVSPLAPIRLSQPLETAT